MHFYDYDIVIFNGSDESRQVRDGRAIKKKGLKI
jgi:hypothetical protein